MCGICGIINLQETLQPDISLLKRMMGRLKHRGPDGSGIYLSKHAALGHVRLSIIDLAGGMQPLANEKENLWISFNGEIFNYLELTTELTLRGHIFKTRCDTEVILHAYEEWGLDCFTHFNGQWAFAVYDSRLRQVLLSRDRMGIRPLFYTFHRGKLYFASEIKALLADPSLPREIDGGGLVETYTFWGPVAPRTAFKDIFELEPGSYALIRENFTQVRPYWFLDYDGYKQRDVVSDQQAIAASLKEKLLEASRLRFTRSDVPVGAYLSGGLDSSIVSSIIRTYSPAQLRTFSVQFQDSDYDESYFQELMIKQISSTHASIRINYQHIAEAFPEALWHMERPVTRTAPVPLFLLSKLVRDLGYKVVMTGEGADEVLAGYDLFLENKVRGFLSREPESVKRAQILNKLYPWMSRNPTELQLLAKSFYCSSLEPADPFFSHHIRWNTGLRIGNLLHPDYRKEWSVARVEEDLRARLPAAFMEWDSLDRAQWLEIKTLLPGYILSAQGDRMLMAHSVEGRFPFLDADLIEFSRHLQARDKILALNEKHLLKLAFKQTIPTAILQRPKQPYRAPNTESFFSDSGPDWLKEVCEEKEIEKTGLFSTKGVKVLLDKCRRTNGQQMSNTDNMCTIFFISAMLLYKEFIQTLHPFGGNEVPPEPLKIIIKEELNG